MEDKMGIENCYYEIVEQFNKIDTHIAELNTQRDRWEQVKEDINCVYKKIVPLLQNQSKNLESLTESILNSKYYSREIYHNWEVIAKSLFGSSLAFKLIQYDNISMDEARKILTFFENGQLTNEVKACGIFAVAQSQKVADPMFCYLNSMKAFRICNNLGEILGINYRYDESRLNNMTFDKCPICGSNNSKPLYCALQANTVGEDNRFAPVKLWMKCSDCTNIYAYNFPVTDMKYINGHYTRSNNEKRIDPRYHLSIYNPIFEKIKELTPGNKYLEIGIGNGEMLAIALEWGYEVTAVEVCREDCENVSAALDVDIRWCDFLEYESDEKYDVIIMGDVLEHVSKPVKALQKAVGMLKDEGVLWISTPNYNSAYARMQKWQHCMWHEKNHFTFFSYEGLVPILDSLNLEVKQYRISDRFIGSMELFVVKKNVK